MPIYLSIIVNVTIVLKKQCALSIYVPTINSYCLIFDTTLIIKKNSIRKGNSMRLTETSFISITVDLHVKSFTLAN